MRLVAEAEPAITPVSVDGSTVGKPLSLALSSALIRILQHMCDVHHIAAFCMSQLFLPSAASRVSNLPCLILFNFLDSSLKPLVVLPDSTCSIKSVIRSEVDEC